MPTCHVFIIFFVFLEVCIELSMLHGWPGNIAEISDTSQTCNNPNISVASEASFTKDQDGHSGVLKKRTPRDAETLD